jgi:hypothetical protein
MSELVYVPNAAVAITCLVVWGWRLSEQVASLNRRVEIQAAKLRTNQDEDGISRSTLRTEVFQRFVTLSGRQAQIIKQQATLAEHLADLNERLDRHGSVKPRRGVTFERIQ